MRGRRADVDADAGQTQPIGIDRKSVGAELIENSFGVLAEMTVAAGIVVHLYLFYWGGTRLTRASRRPSSMSDQVSRALVGPTSPWHLSARKAFMRHVAPCLASSASKISWTLGFSSWYSTCQPPSLMLLSAFQPSLLAGEVRPNSPRRSAR